MGPFLLGQRRIDVISLKKWQKQLLNELNDPLAETLRDRGVIWV